MKEIIAKIYNECVEKLDLFFTSDIVSQLDKQIVIFYDSSRVDYNSAYIQSKIKWFDRYKIPYLIIDIYNLTEEKIIDLCTTHKNNFIFYELPIDNNARKIFDRYLTQENDIDGLLGCDFNYDKSKILYLPATVEATLAILSHIDLKDKNIIVIGRSRVLGGYIYKYLLERAYFVDIIGSTSGNKVERISHADVVVSAINQALVYNSSILKDNANLVDITIELVDNKIKGSFVINDEDKDRIKYTPVPGGVGKLTTLFLIENYMKYILSKIKKED